MTTSPQRESSSNARRAAVAIAATAALAAPALALAAKPGDLDTRFGGDGKVLRDLGIGDRAEDLVVQPDRKVVTVSTVEFRNDYAIQVNRFLANGRIDSRFANEGRRIIALPGDEYAPDVALADRGRIVVSFRADTNDAPVGVARLTARGEPDESFDGDGLQTVGFGAEIDSFDAPVDVAVAPGDDIVVAGSGARADADPQGSDFTAIRLNASGGLRESFGDGGRAVVDAGGSDEARALDVDNQGRVVIAGDSYVHPGTRQLAVARLTADGEPDPAFAGDGGQTSELMRGSADITVMPGGGVALAGVVSGDFGAVRIAENGSPDASFSDDGLATVDFADSTDSAVAITQDDGRLILGGPIRTQRRGFDFGVARLSAAGAPDRGFSDDGRRATDFGKSSDEAASLDVDGRGAIVVGGGIEKRSGGDRYDTGLLRVLGRRR
ncbi:hypothetical protein HJD18_00530 [Thermoleophilia bacterium SCSIO 60948]|nr:hypothetical protein HJD18_00530 [Thermoleophilia bacterium SCSIO 60948]